MKKTDNTPLNPSVTLSPKALRRRKLCDILASVGMVLLLVALILPIIDIFDVERLHWFKWIFTAGAVMFTVAKCIRILPKECSISIRRLYRLEFWAGVCFLIATFFWFYNEYKMSALPLKGALSILHDTILFAMSGAVVQLIASWMIYFREKKEITNPGA